MLPARLQEQARNKKANAMTRSPTSSKFSFTRLAAHWQAVVVMLVLVGRRISAGKKLGSHEAYTQAEQMELWSRAALACLSQQLTVLEQAPAPDSPEEQRARAHLSTLMICLMGLAMLATKWKDELKALSGGGAVLVSLCRYQIVGMCAEKTYTPVYLDSS